MIPPIHAEKPNPSTSLTQAHDNDHRLRRHHFSGSDPLQSQFEVCLVVDGLDEVPRSRAANLLRQLGTLVDCWSNAQVLATGRPVELAGVSYETWGLSRLDQLSDADKKAIFQAEACADRCLPSDVIELARARLSFLKNHPALDELASTPLSVRLLYPKLGDGTLPVVDSIGDLLYELLIERLGEWSERDQKGNPLQRFESTFGTAEDRAEVLGALACVAALKQVRREEAEEVLLGRVGGDRQIAKQALAFFQQAGLLSLDEEVAFNFQPLLEMSAGVATLGQWRVGSTLAHPVPWRIAAFAATIARRRGLLDQVRTRLQAVTDELLQTSGGVPAACMIASEARDPILACTIIDGFRRLGRKPLRWSKAERFAVAQTIAHTIHLAGDKGFDWFVEDYLDARYPIVHQGSMVIEEVLHHWTRIGFRTITEKQRQKLQPLVAPLLVSEGLLVNLLPSLAMLVPEEFQEKQKVWFASTLLDDDLLGAEADQLLTRFNIPANRPVLMDILCRRTGSRKAIALFFKLFPAEKPPVPIAIGLLRWKAHDSENQVLVETLATCINLIGEERWYRFLRWCLSAEESSVVGGAVILLYERGETRLNIIGGALLNALHDGGYVRKAEEILSNLVGQRGKEGGVRWLAWHLANRRGYDGGHSGFWRVLLQHLDPMGEHSPDILAECAGAIGPYLLTRYPEVRDGLQRLLTGPRGQEFRKALRARLSDPDLHTRHGAGSILITCDPGSEADALFVVVATRAGNRMMSHEWEPFCLSLAFGPSILENLRSRLGRMGHEARAFALAILRRHRVALSTEELEALFGHLLEVGNWALGAGDGEETGFESDEGFEYLRRQIASPVTASTPRAAERLLSLFEDRLSPRDAAMCCSLICSGGSCNPYLLRNQIVRVLRETDYRSLMSNTFETVARGLGQITFLEHVAAASGDPIRWRDVVWNLLYSGIGFEVEDMGQILLDLGRDFPEYAKPIGEATQHLLQDPRAQDDHRGESRHWLALLASEFATLAPAKLQQVLTEGEWITWNCARALLARLGTVPEGLPSMHRTAAFPEDLGGESFVAPTTDELVGRLTDWLRPANSFHPGTCDAIGQFLYFGDLREESLGVVARKGTFGVMVSEAIRFCGGLHPSLHDRLTLVRSGGLPRRVESDRPFQRLRYNVRRFHETYFEEEPAARESYAVAVEESMRRDAGSVASLAAELLRFRGRLPVDLVSPVFEDAATHLRKYEEELALGIIHWVDSLQSGTEADAVRHAAEHAIEVLAQQGRGNHMAQFPPYAHVLFPIVVWVLGGKASEESIDLYWNGIKLVFSVSSGEIGVKRSVAFLQDFDPLLAKVPQTVWTLVREEGVRSDNPSVRALVGMLGGFAGVLPQAVAFTAPNSSLGPPEPQIPEE